MSPGHPGNPSVIEFFMAMLFDQLTRTNKSTTANLVEKEKNISVGEILKFIRILEPTTRYEFGDRAEFWSTESNYIYTVYIHAVSLSNKSACHAVDLTRFGRVWGTATINWAMNQIPAHLKVDGSCYSNL